MTDTIEDDALLLPEDVASEALPRTSYQPPVEQLPTPEFQPWHRPRKHYVRTRQWSSMVRSLINQTTDEIFDYLGLPGHDLLDLELFLSECTSRSKVLRYLGFDVSAADETVESVQRRVTADVVSRSAGVHRDSRILPDDIGELAVAKSRARDAARGRTFDVVNLDLCGSRMKNSAGEDGLYDTLNAILDLQSSRVEPWVLFITATFDRRGATPQNLTQIRALSDELQIRIADCAELDDELSVFADADLPKSSDCGEAEFCLVAAAGLVSWLWRVAQQHRPSNVKFASFMGYRLRHESAGPDMLSLGLRFTPKSRRIGDPAGLLSPPVEDGLQTGCAQLAQMLARLEALKDVDVLLRGDQVLFDECRSATAELLVRRGYKREEYYGSEMSGHFGNLDHAM